MRLAVREDIVPGTSLPDKLDWLSKHGFEGIELCGASLGYSSDELTKIFDRTAIKVANVAGSAQLLHPDQSERSAAMMTMRSRIELAGLLDAVGVLTIAQFGRTPMLPDVSPYKSYMELETELLVAELRELAPAAAEAGVVMFLEPLNRYEQHLINRLDQAAAIAGRIGPEVMIMADFFHMNIEEENLEDSIAKTADRIVHIHIADSNRRQPGAGHLNFLPGLAQLKRAGYEGFIGIECELQERPEDTLAKSADVVRDLWEQA